jgi:hypothetical protein
MLRDPINGPNVLALLVRFMPQALVQQFRSEPVQGLSLSLRRV